MVTLINPTDLSYEDYLIEKEKNPLFFWNYKREDRTENVFIGYRVFNTGSNNIVMGNACGMNTLTI
ncbi:MAG TPA: hypothetical protein ENI23_11800 [bacterium]|nr:hypothetical protein [bacterium]